MYKNLIFQYKNKKLIHKFTIIVSSRKHLLSIHVVKIETYTYRVLSRYMFNNLSIFKIFFFFKCVVLTLNNGYINNYLKYFTNLNKCKLKLKTYACGMGNKYTRVPALVALLGKSKISLDLLCKIISNR